MAAETKFSNILVALDGSEQARKAASVAIDLAEKYGAHITFLTVIQIAFEGGGPVRPASKDFDRAERVLDEAIKIARDKGLRDRAFDIVLEQGSPAQQIVDYANRNESDLIVMGNRGLGHLTGLLLGSVSSKVLGLAACPVLAVK